jgi:predicted ester cyclase
MHGLYIPRFRLILGVATLLVGAVVHVAAAAQPSASQTAADKRLDANKALVRAFLKALEEGDIAALNRLRGAEGSTHSPHGESRRASTSTILAERCPMCAALPDRKISIDRMAAEGDLVTVQSTWTGTYTGTHRGTDIAPPRPVTMRYVNIYRIADGWIVENWASYDRLHLSEQLGFALATAKDQASTADTDIVGTWRLVSFEDVEDGKIVRPFGDKPNGLFVYTADGHVIIHIAHPANPACYAPGKISGRGKRDNRASSACSPEQMRKLLDNSVAYWGAYTVDAAAGVVTHKVKSDLSNGYAGTDQPRPFRLEGDRLVIGDGKTWTRVLERVVR